MTRQNPNVNNQLRYQRKRLQTTQMMGMYGNGPNPMIPGMNPSTSSVPNVSQ